MEICSVCRLSYDSVSSGIIPVMVVGVEGSVFPVHTMRPGYINMMGYAVMIIRILIPDRDMMG